MIDIKYLELLEKILTEGHIKGGRNGETRSIFSAQIEHDMKDGFPLITTKKMAWHQVRTEFLWMVMGNTNIRWLLENNNKIWVGDAYKAYKKHCNQMTDDVDESILKLGDGGVLRTLTREEFIHKIKTDTLFAIEFGELGPIYGQQYRASGWNRPPIDQLQRSLDLLRDNPESRKNVVSAWIPEDLGAMTLEPCHYAFKFYTRPLPQEERLDILDERSPADKRTVNIGNVDPLELNNIPEYALSLKWNQRSVDVPLGLPFNIAFYGTMLEVYSRLANMVPEKLIGNLSDVHIYNNQMDGAYQQLDRTPINCQPKLVFPETVEFGNSIDDFVGSVKPEDFQIEGYESHGKIKFPLSN